MKRRGIAIAALALAFALALMFGTSFAAISQEDISAINKDIQAKGYSWVAGENSITRMSDQERWALLMHGDLPKPDVQPPAKLAALTTLPSEFDWRNKDGNNWDTPIRNQLGCGSCWTFGSVAIIEPRAKIELGMPDYQIDLSEQQLLSCSGMGGCGGGTPQGALNYAATTGLVPESCFPYTGTEQSCSNICANWEDKKMKISGVTYCGWNEDLIKQTIVEKGPVSIIFLVYTDFFSYNGGIYAHTSNQTAGLHSISIVGYNDTGGYWICKNSWGSDWGENGYFRLSYSEDAPSWNDNRAFWMFWTTTFNQTDITDPPALLNATTDAAGYVRSTSDINISVNARAGSIKNLASVKLEGISMAGPLSGGVFQLIGTPAKLGCRGGRRLCEFSINATDEFNFSSAAFVQVGIADAAVNVQSPVQGGPYYDSAVSLNYSAVSYEDPVDSCWYILDGGAQVQLPGCANATISNLSFGPHNLSVRENDTSGYEARQDVQFVIVPHANVSLSYGAVWAKTYVNFPFNVRLENAGSTQCVIVDSSGRTRFSRTITRSGTYAAYLSESRNGEYHYTITCYVSAQVETTANLTIYFDSVAPKIVRIAPEDYTNSSTVNIAYIATDNLAEEMNCTITGAPNGTHSATVENGTQDEWKTSYGSDGIKSVVVQCKDVAGNAARYYLSFTLDTVSPALSIISLAKSGLNPDNTSSVTIRYGIIDRCARMREIKYSVDGGAPVQLGTAKSGGFTARIPRGSHSIKIIATDLAQNSNSVTAYVNVY